MIELIIECLIAVAAALIIRRYIMVVSRIKGDSMRDTLFTGDVVFCWRLGVRRGKIKRGDIVVCRYPNEAKKLFIKRVIALPGETIEISDGVPVIDGVLLDEPYIKYHARRSAEPLTLTYGQYYVMGDNRPNSRDSRRVGPISADMIAGRAVVRLWPLKRVGLLRQRDSNQ